MPKIFIIENIQKQIIDYLNQVKYQSRLIEKLRQIKYLKDQFELEEKSNINSLLSDENAVVFETRTTFPLKLSLDLLQDEAVYTLIKEIGSKTQNTTKPKLLLAESISQQYLQEENETEVFVNIEEMKNNFMASGNHLFDFVMNYKYPKEFSVEEKLVYYCELISVYENEFELSEQFAQANGTEYAIVYPK